MLCSRCKKRIAMIFLSKMENGKPVNEGLCLKCAKELNLPQVTAMMEQMGITDDDIDAISDQMTELANGDSFEPGGNQTMPAFLQNMMNGVGEMMQSMKQQGEDLPANPPAPKTGNAGKRERRDQPKKYKFWIVSAPTSLNGPERANWTTLWAGIERFTGWFKSCPAAAKITPA